MRKTLRVSPPPRRVAVRGGPGYAIKTGWTAVHGGIAPEHGPHPVLALEDGRVRVYDEAPPADRDGVPGPVYAMQGGEIAVPTGRVFVRFAADERADARREDLQRAGYVIEDAPTWAPHAAWVHAADRGIATALLGLARLEAIAGVERVEPEMLLVAQRR